MGKIKINDNYLIYEVLDSEIVLEEIKVFEQRKGIGTALVDKLKDIANKHRLPIGLYCKPLDDTIEEDNLREFYFSNGFELDPDDFDGNLFIWD